jgi:hypothetical protein
VNRLPSVYQDPVVQASVQTLEAERVSPDQRRREQAAPQRQPQQAQAAPQQQPQQQTAPPVQAPRQAPPPAQPIVEQDLSAPPAAYVAQPIRGSVASDPQSVEAWVEALVAKGWNQDMAMSLAAHKPDEPIGDALKGEILSIAFGYFGRDGARVRDAFAGTGFTPMPNLPEQLKPKPTGLQLLRFAVKMDLNSNHEHNDDDES